METHSLKYLLPLDIMQSRIQILDSLHNIWNLPFICALDRACLSCSQVQRQLDSPNRHSRGEPAVRGSRMRRCETDPVVSRVGSTESEAAFRGTSSVDNAVVVIEDFIDGYRDTKGRGRLEGSDVGIELFGFVVS